MSGGVRVSCILNSNFNLTQKSHDKYVEFAAVRSTDRFQVWNIRYDPKKMDAKGNKAFALTNACSGKAMKYNGIDNEVLLVPYAKGDDTQLWISDTPVDDPNQNHTLEPFTNKEQCLTAVLNQDGTIDEESEVLVSSDCVADNQVWSVVACK